MRIVYLIIKWFSINKNIIVKNIKLTLKYAGYFLEYKNFVCRMFPFTSCSMKVAVKMKSLIYFNNNSLYVRLIFEIE